MPQDFKVKKLEVSNTFTCALSLKGKVSCFGPKIELFNPNTGTSFTDLPEAQQGYGKVIDFGTTESVIDIGLGYNFACALFSNGRIKCWGPAAASLGYGNDTTSVYARPNETAASRSDAIHVSKAPFIDLGANALAKQIAIGRHHSCALLTSGAMKCWGTNVRGAPGVGSQLDQIGLNGGMGDNLLSVNLGTNHEIAQIYAGPNISCALFSDTRIKCWGSNYNGNLGLGDSIDRGRSSTEMGDNLPFLSLPGVN